MRIFATGISRAVGVITNCSGRIVCFVCHNSDDLATRLRQCVIEEHSIGKACCEEVSMTDGLFDRGG